MTRFMVLVALLSIHQSIASAADNKTLWDDAAQKYDSGDYRASSELYTRLIERGFAGPELYYNLGNSYFKSGSLGASIWAFRRALKIDPGMKQARTNLAYVRELNLDKIVVKRGGFMVDIWNSLTGLLSVNGYILAFATVWWLLGLLLTYIILKPRVELWPQYLLILFIIAAIFAGAASVTRIRNDRLTRWGVLTVSSAEIREGPGEDFEKIEVGHEGLEFKILGEREKSYLVELDNGLRGWISIQAVLEI